MVSQNNAHWMKLAMLWPKLALASRQILVAFAEGLSQMTLDNEDVEALTRLAEILGPKPEGGKE